MNNLEFFAVDFSLYIFFYVTLAVGSYFLFWKLLKNKWQNRRIQQKVRATPARIRSEVYFSLASFMMFVFIDYIAFKLEKAGYTLLYQDIAEKGLLYFWLTPLIVIVVHDAYFYWMHRLVHHKSLYKAVHLRHHLSVDPTPLSGFAFGFFEMFTEAFFNLLIVFIIPTQFYSLLIFQFLATIFIVIGHLGYEVYPKGFTKNKWTAWKATGTHHNMHHEKFNGHYGLYFTFWDKLCGTEFKDYHERFDQAAGGELVQEKDLDMGQAS